MTRRKTGGRQKGTLNKVTVEAKAACAAIVDDPTYRKNLTARARRGDLAPAIEAMLWHYAYGKPKETVALTVGEAPNDLSELSAEELLQQADELRERLRERVARERSLPAEYRTA